MSTSHTGKRGKKRNKSYEEKMKVKREKTSMEYIKRHRKEKCAGVYFLGRVRYFVCVHSAFADRRAGREHNFFLCSTFVSLR